MRKKGTIAILVLASLLVVALIAVVYGQDDSCRQTLSGDGTVSGTWAAGCDSQVSGRGHAKFYGFTLSETSEITVTLESTDADTYLYLWSGDATSGDFLFENDDHEGSTQRSRIQENLEANTYTIEATTYGPGVTGDFTLTVAGIPAAAPVSTPEPTAGTTPAATPDSTPATTPEPTPGSTPEPTPPPESLSQMIERVRPAVVKIFNPADEGQGSGAIFKTEGMNGYVITNHHVVDNTLEATVIVQDVTEYTGTVIGVDEARDLAVVRICCGDFPTLEFGDSTVLNVGDPVVVIGYALDYAQPTAADGPARVIVPGAATVTQGIISAFRHDTPNDRDLVQTDTATNPGNSGGPWLTTDGTIIGIHTFTLLWSEGLNYAVLETTVQERLPDLMAGVSPPTVVDREPSIVRLPMVGPDAGHFHHTPLDGRMGLISAGVPVRRDVLASAVFTNPYSRQTGDFAYGFMLRSTAESNLRFDVHSDGRWQITLWKDQQFQPVVSGSTGNLLRTGADERNMLEVMVIGDFGALFLNGRALTDPEGDGFITLGTDTGAGRVYIVNGPYNGAERAGAVTHYEEFIVDDFITNSAANAASLLAMLSELEREQFNLLGPAEEETHYLEE